VSDVAVSYHKQPKRGKSTALIMKQDTRESTTPMKRRRSSGVIPNKENPEDSEGPRTSPKSESKTSPSSVMIVTSRVKTPSMLLKTSPVSTPAPSKRLTIDESKNRLISELSIRLTTTEESEDTPTGSNSNVTTPHSDRSTNESRSARTDSATDSPIQERSSVKENRRKLRNSVMFNLQLLERELKEIERNKLTDEDLDLLMRKSSAGSARRPKLSTTSLVKSDSDVNNNNNSLENSENTEPKNSVNEVDPHQQKIQIKKAKLSLSDNSVLVQRHLNMPEEYATVVASVDHKEKSPRDHNLDPNTYLKCINMANNIISDISPNAFMFPLLHNALEILDLSNNLLETLPPEINMLKRLQQLCVQRNFLKELPKEIGDLKYLRILYVYNNFLENVPEEITRCKSLKTIHIQNNKLSSLPLELASLALEDLQVRRIPITI
jgi:Leucine-rich repeat (LRR) protein